MKTWVAAILLCVMLGSLGGCIALGFGGNSTTIQPTTGQQLTDLKTALDRGAINQQEYDQQKAAILSAHK